MNANSHGPGPHFDGTENFDPQAAANLPSDGAHPDMTELLAAAERGELSEEAMAELGQQATASVLESLGPTLDTATPLDAEIWVSSLIGHLAAIDQEERAAQIDSAVGETDEESEDLPLKLLASIALVGTRSSLGFLRVVESIGETEEQRAAAGTHADQLVAQGLVEPAWLGQVGTATPGECWSMTDIHGEQMSLLCEYAYGARTHALLALIEFNETNAWWVRDLTAIDEEDVPDVKAQVQATAQAMPGLMNLEQVAPARGRELLEAGLSPDAQHLAAQAQAEEAAADAEIPDDLADLDPELAQALAALDAADSDNDNADEDQAGEPGADEPGDDDEEGDEVGVSYLRMFALARARVMPAP